MIDEHSREDELIVQIIGLQGKIERLKKERQDDVVEFLEDIERYFKEYQEGGGYTYMIIFKKKWEGRKK